MILSSYVTHRAEQFTVQHCYVTGGSAGLGLALAVLLTKKGADVSIVARNEERLQKALAEMEVSPSQLDAYANIQTHDCHRQLGKHQTKFCGRTLTPLTIQRLRRPHWMLLARRMEVVVQMPCSCALEQLNLAFSWKKVRALSAKVWIMATGFKHGLHS